MSEDNFQSSVWIALNGSDDFNEDKRDYFSDDDDDDDDNGGDDGEMGNHDSNNQKTTEIENELI